MAGAESVRPSILLVVTDDQRWDTLWAMPELQRSLVARGVMFTNMFASSPLCAPSRASILTGCYPHTTRVFTQGPPWGGFVSFDDTTTFATLLHDAGYRTGFFGKYVDAYQSGALSGYVPPGWDRWVAFVRSRFYDYGLTVDGVVRRYGSEPEAYSTDVLAAEAEAFVRDGSSDAPILVVWAPAAPHHPATPAPGDEHLFSDLEPWSVPSLDDPDVSDEPTYLRRRAPFDPAERAEIDELRRNQYRSLVAVDRGLGRLMRALAATRGLDVIVLYTSDNGLMWGEHRWRKKEVPFEEAIRVPLVVRADSLVRAAPSEVDRLVGGIDLAPTIADLAGVEMPDADGRSLVPLLSGRASGWRSALLVEHVEGRNPVPTYVAVRTDRYVFVKYATGERQLFDLEQDPAQLENITARRPDVVSELEGELGRLLEARGREQG